MWKWRPRSDDDFAEEIRANIVIETDRLIATGMNTDAAHAAARRAFGNVTHAHERFYESHRVMWLDDLQRDTKYALRTLATHPGFAAIAILMLALGIGANTTIFTLLDAVVLKPLSVPAADELITLHENGSEGVADVAGGTGRYLRFSYPRFQRLAAALGSHGVLAAVTRSSPFVLRQSDTASRTRILDAAAGLDPRDSMRGHTLVVEPFARGFSGLRARYTDALLALAALVAIVLLVTCSSVATLLLARAAGNARDSGIRTALGATAGRLVRQGLTESVLLALAGGAIGLFAGECASGFLARQVLGAVNHLPHVFSPDVRVLSFTAGSAIFTVLVFGLAPAIRGMRVGREATPGSRPRGGIDRSAMKGMRPLVTLQVALYTTTPICVYTNEPSGGNRIGTQRGNQFRSTSTTD